MMSVTNAELVLVIQSNRIYILNMELKNNDIANNSRNLRPL
jgi:hypothetical protein